jgi:hypothetical protein
MVAIFYGLIVLIGCSLAALVLMLIWRWMLVVWKGEKKDG